MRWVRDASLGFIPGLILLLIQAYAGTDLVTATWRALVVAVVIGLGATYLDRRQKERGASSSVWSTFYPRGRDNPKPEPPPDPPKLRMDDTLTMDAATRNHAVYFRLRFWNDGGGAITPEVRVTRVVLSDGTAAPFSGQLPLLLGWSSLGGTPPALTRLHTAGETVGVLGALNWMDRTDIPGSGYPIDPPSLYIAGEYHHAEIGQMDDRLFIQVQAIVPGQSNAIERWFWVEVEKAKEKKGYYARTGHVEGDPTFKV